MLSEISSLNTSASARKIKLNNSWSRINAKDLLDIGKILTIKLIL